MKKNLLFLILAVAGLAIGFTLKGVQATESKYIPMQAAPASGSQNIIPSAGGGSCG